MQVATRLSAKPETLSMSRCLLQRFAKYHHHHHHHHPRIFGFQVCHWDPPIVTIPSDADSHSQHPLPSNGGALNLSVGVLGRTCVVEAELWMFLWTQRSSHPIYVYTTLIYIHIISIYLCMYICICVSIYIYILIYIY